MYSNHALLRKRPVDIAWSLLLFIVFGVCADIFTEERDMLIGHYLDIYTCDNQRKLVRDSLGQVYLILDDNYKGMMQLAIDRNFESWESLPNPVVERQWIVDFAVRVRLVREVTVPRGSARHRGGEAPAGAFDRALPTEEAEQLVTDERAANRGTELVPLVDGLFGAGTVGKEVRSGEFVVAQELV